MADSFIQLSPDSTGKKVDTRTAPDGDHREVLVVGSPTTADVAEADAANGLDVDVTRLPALAAGTNNIGDVDVLTVPAPLSTTGGGTEATAHRVTIASDSTGVLSVDDNGGSLTVDGTVAVSGAVDTELPVAAALADNAANPTAPAVGAFGMVWDGVTWDRAAGSSADGALVNLGANNDVSLNAGTNNIGDVDVLTVPAPLSTSGGGTEATALRVTVASDSTGVLSVDDNGGSLTVDGTVGVSGTVDTELPAAAALGDATANPTTPLVGAALETFNGTTWDRARGDTTNGLDVDVTRLPSLVAGTANIGDVDVLTLPSIPAGTNNIGDVDVLTMPVVEVVGDVAADAAVPANPLAIGGRASTATPTAVSADGDSVYAWLNRNGLQVVSAIPGLGLNADPYLLSSETAQYTTTQTSTVLVTGAAGERIIVTSIQIQAGGTTAAAVQVYFGTGAYSRGNDEAIFDGEFAPSATLKPGFYAAPPSGFRAGALGDDILVTTSAGITLTVTVWYYLQEV